MKTIKNMLLLVVITTVVEALFTSCLGDDNDKSFTKTVTLTKQEIAVRNQTLSGKWEGKLYFLNETTLRSDSTFAVWAVDTVEKTITFNNFPVRVIANYVGASALKDKLSKADNQPLVFQYASVEEEYKEYYDMYYFRYHFAPKGNVAKFKLDDEDVEVNFATSLSDSKNIYNPMAVFYKGVLSGNILLGSVSFRGYTSQLNALLSFGGEQIGR